MADLLVRFGFKGLQLGAVLTSDSHICTMQLKSDAQVEPGDPIKITKEGDGIVCEKATANTDIVIGFAVFSRNINLFGLVPVLTRGKMIVSAVVAVFTGIGVGKLIGVGTAGSKNNKFQFTDKVTAFKSDGTEDKTNAYAVHIL